ncbi:hypothetical protein H4I96_12168 [Botrytis cinerea]
MSANYQNNAPGAYEQTRLVNTEVELLDLDRNSNNCDSKVEQINTLSSNAWAWNINFHSQSCYLLHYRHHLHTNGQQAAHRLAILDLYQCNCLHLDDDMLCSNDAQQFGGILATLGALITISRLGFAPFTQQVIKLQSRNVIMENSNNIANTDTYNLRQDPSMEAAILQGVYNISTTPVFSCPGTCSWNSSYISIGFKSICENVTTTTLNTKTCAFDNDTGITTCNMTTPKGIEFSMESQSTNYATTLQLKDTLVPMTEIPELVNIAIYRSSINATGDIGEVWNENITECTLSITAYNYSGAYAQGNNFQFASVEEFEVPKNLWNMSGNGGDSDFNNSLEIGSIWTNGPTTGSPRLVMGYGDVTSLRAYFRSDMILTEWRDGGGWLNTNYGISPALIGDTDLPGLFQKMAESMTDYVRSGPNHQLARGNSIESVIFISIRWSWLVGPVCVELAAVVFAIFTIFQSYRHREVPLWKSSVIAVLSCHHDKDFALIRNGSTSIKDIEQTAKISLVKLE